MNPYLQRLLVGLLMILLVGGVICLGLWIVYLIAFAINTIFF